MKKIVFMFGILLMTIILSTPVVSARNISGNEVMPCMVTELNTKGLTIFVPDFVVRKSIREFMNNSLKDTFLASSIFRRNVFVSALFAPFDKAKRLISAYLRNYLKDPQNLVALYNSKKEIFVEELRNSDMDKTRLIEWLNRVKGGFSAFGDEKFKKAYADYLAKENKWQQNRSDRTQSEAYQKAKLNLASLTPDLFSSLFIGRRANENLAVVAAYENIVADITDTVQQQ